MVVKTRSSATKVAKSNRFRICMEFAFGPFQSIMDANNTKRQVKAKVPKIKLSGVSKSRSGFAFKGKTTYIKNVAAPANVLKRVLQNSAPAARVSVTKI